MKGIVLAGGAGTRLYPCTTFICKQLLPVYDKPMIYYPLSTLMLAGIKDILFISTPEDTPKIKSALGDGSELGMNFKYQIQESPEGIAQAFIIGEDFIGTDKVCLILGDNLFYGHGFPDALRRAKSFQEGGAIFGYWVKNPQQYGVVDFDDEEKVVDIKEKPLNPSSNYAVPGIYFYDHEVVEITRNLKPSARGELEITDVNRAYLAKSKLNVELLGRGIAWLDTGTPDSLLEAASFVAAIERRQGLKIACLEEVAYRMGFLDANQLKKVIEELPEGDYRQYLEYIIPYGG